MGTTTTTFAEHSIGLSSKFDVIKSGIESTNDRIENEVSELREEFCKQMEDMESRLEYIQKYNEKLDKDRRQRHLMQLNYLNERQKATEKLYKSSLIANIVFGIIIIAFAIILTKITSKYDTVVDQYTNLADNYIEITNKYDEMHDEIDMVLEEMYIMNDINK